MNHAAHFFFAALVLAAASLGGCSAAANVAVVDAAVASDASVPADLASAPDLAAPETPVDLAAHDLAMIELPTIDLGAVDLAAQLLVPGDLSTRLDSSPASDLALARDLLNLDGALCAGGPVHFAWDGGIAGLNDPFADRVISFQPGANAGFGQNRFPQIVLGPPEGAGANLGSVDVLSLGLNGVIILALDDIGIIDGPGPDLLIFENSTVNFKETGYIAVSDDGVNWTEWPCNPTDAQHDFPGCGGQDPVYANSMNGIDPTDPAKAGGNAFDLKTIGVARARYVRIRDSGHNFYSGTTGGFDLDAIAVVNGAPISCW